MARPPDDELRRHYAGYYGAHSPQVPDEVKKRLAEVVRTFEHYRRSGRLLDVGFGQGWLLRAAAVQGWSCWGTEMASESLRLAESEGWNVVDGSLASAGFPSEHFDVVTMVEVLEHLRDPATYLLEAARTLRPGGLLYGSTPNARSINARVLKLDWSIYSPVEHLQLFTPRALHEAITSAGYEVIKIRAEGLNPVELLSRRSASVPALDRVEAGYALNQRVTASGAGRLLKTVINRALSWTQLGDSLKFWAIRL